MHCSTLVSVLCVQACDARERSGSSALFLAAYHGHQDCIRVLVEAGATVQVRGANLEMCTAAVQVWVAGVWVMIVWVMTVQACDRWCCESCAECVMFSMTMCYSLAWPCVSCFQDMLSVPLVSHTFLSSTLLSGIGETMKYVLDELKQSAGKSNLDWEHGARRTHATWICYCSRTNVRSRWSLTGLHERNE